MGVLLGRKGGGSGGGGGGGGIPDPVTDTVTISPDTDEAALVINTHPGSGQATHPLEVFDENGDPALDIDSQGILDSKHIVVQDPPSTGGPPGSVAIRPGAVDIVSDGSTTPLVVTTLDGHTAILSLRPSGFGSLFDISPKENDDTAIAIISPLAPTVDALQVWDNAFNNVLFAITSTGGIRATLPTANPGPGLLWNDAGVVKVGT